MTNNNYDDDDYGDDDNDLIGEGIKGFIEDIKSIIVN